MNYKNFLKLTINLLLVISLLGAGFCFPRIAKAQEEFSNLRILYQGDLSDSEGNPVEDGRYDMRFGIYDTQEEGDILWLEEYTFYDAIFVKDGQFKVILGRMASVNLGFLSQAGFDLDQEFWLGVTVGTRTEEGEIVWNKEMEPRKKIITLSELLEGEETVGKKWEDILRLVKEKLGEQPDLVVLFDLEKLEEMKIDEESPDLVFLSIFQNFISFINEKLSEIKEKIYQIGEKIDTILLKLEETGSALANMKYKIDALYDVLIVQKGLGSAEVPETSLEEITYNNKKVESLIFKEGETSLRIFNLSIKEESLIFVSFLDDPGSGWWISEKIPGHSFTISLEEPPAQDLRFDYWILEEGEIEEQTQPSVDQSDKQQPEEEIQPTEEQEQEGEQSAEEVQPEEEQLSEEATSSEEEQLEEQSGEEKPVEASEEEQIEEIQPESE